MRRLDDELRDLAAQLASSVDTSSTFEEMQRRTLRRREGRSKKAWALLVAGMIGIGAFVPLFLALRGSHQVPAASTTSSPSSSQFKLEGRLTIFAAHAGEDGSHLYTITGSGTPQLLASDIGNPIAALAPSWSPDGTRFVVEESQTGSGLEPPPGKLVIVDSVTGRETTLIESKFVYEYAEWSPLGDEIAFSTGNGDTYVIHTDGSGLMKLTEPGPSCLDGAISWSPDGERIAFGRDCEGLGDSGVYVMGADGSDPHLIADAPAVLQTAWSPDGRTLAFMRLQRYDTLPFTDETVYTVGVDGSDPRRLANRSSSPTWSPDGSAIAVLKSGVVAILSQDGDTLTTVENTSDLTVYWVVSWSAVPP
jgi:Tol biopolymer transport system component